MSRLIGHEHEVVIRVSQKIEALEPLYFAV